MQAPSRKNTFLNLAFISRYPRHAPLMATFAFRSDLQQVRQYTSGTSADRQEPNPSSDQASDPAIVKPLVRLIAKYTAQGVANERTVAIDYDHAGSADTLLVGWTTRLPVSQDLNLCSNAESRLIHLAALDKRRNPLIRYHNPHAPTHTPAGIHLGGRANDVCRQICILKR